MKDQMGVFHYLPWALEDPLVSYCDESFPHIWRNPNFSDILLQPEHTYVSKCLKQEDPALVEGIQWLSAITWRFF